MKQHLDRMDVQDLTPAQWAIMYGLWDQSSFCPENDDDQIRLFIPEERDNEGGPVFWGAWGQYTEFEYPHRYSGRLRRHTGTLVPLLSIGEMIELLLTFGMEVPAPVDENYCDQLWQACQTFFEAEEEPSDAGVDH